MTSDPSTQPIDEHDDARYVYGTSEVVHDIDDAASDVTCDNEACDDYDIEMSVELEHESLNDECSTHWHCPTCDQRHIVWSGRCARYHTEIWFFDGGYHVSSWWEEPGNPSASQKQWHTVPASTDEQAISRVNDPANWS